MECPCKNCTPETGRSATCHGTCEKYLEWSRLNAKERDRVHRIRSELYDKPIHSPHFFDQLRGRR